MYNSQYYTCEQIDQRLLQGYLDDYNTQTGQSLTKEQFLTKLGSVFAKETVIDNTAVNIGYFVCDTAAGTSDKAVTAVGYELFHGGSIKVKFNNRNTAGSATLNINNKGAKALYYGGNPVSASNSWDNGEVVEIYYDGTNYYANNVEGNFKDGIFDISAYNLIEGQPTKYATLAEALGTNGNNIPYIFRKGGMQIKYVSTSDNKDEYQQYRLLTSTFSDNAEDWAVLPNTVEIDNAEYVQVTTDADDKILEGIKADGTKVIETPLEIQGVRQETIDNPEFIKVTTDDEGKIIEATRKDGKKVFYGGIEGLEKEIQSVVDETIEEEFTNKSTTDKFSEENGHLLWNGGSIEGDGITQAEADERYAAKSVESTVAAHTLEIKDIKTSLDVNPPAVVALRNEIDQTEARVDNIENQMGITPPILSGYKKIASETIITQAELNSWDGCVVEIIADVKFGGSTDFTLKSDCILFFNGGKFVSDSYTGTLNLNSAYVKAEPYQIVDTEIKTTGQLNADIGYGEWFGAKGDGTSFDAKAFNALYEKVKTVEIHLVPDKTYVFEATVYMDSTIFKGAQNAKIIRNDAWADVEVLTDLSNGKSAQDGLLTIEVDTTNATYSDLKVGMGVHIVPRDKTDRNDLHMDLNERVIVSISNGTIVLSNGSFTRTGSRYYSLIVEYPMIMAFGNSEICRLTIDGGYQTIPLDRAYWRFSETIMLGEVDTPFGCKNVVVRDCMIDNSVSDAIVVGGNSVLVEHNYIRHCGSNCVHVGSSKSTTVKDNYFFDTNLNMLTGHNNGAFAYSNNVYDLIITGNFFDNCLYCIGGINSADDCKTIITDNVFANFRQSAIDIVFTDSPTFGKRYRDYIISNNRFVATQEYLSYYEPYFDEEPYIPRQTAAGYAIIANWANNARCELMNISGNLFRDCAISLQGCDDLIVANNNFLTKHEYAEGEESMRDYIVIQKATVANIIGNMIRNDSDPTTRTFMRVLDTCIANIANNMYKGAAGTTVTLVQVGENATVQNVNNIEF